MLYRLIFITLLFVLGATPALAGFDPIDGTYDAHITTSGKVYRMPVVVKQGRVATVLWSNGLRITLTNARIRDGAAVGQSSDGLSFIITIHNLEYQYDDRDNFYEREERRDLDDN